MLELIAMVGGKEQVQGFCTTVVGPPSSPTPRVNLPNPNPEATPTPTPKTTGRPPATRATNR
jgi:hypothetical protein